MRSRRLRPSTVRFLVSVLVAAVAAAVVWPTAGGRYVLLAVPIALAATYVAWSATVLARISSEHLKASASQEDSNRLVSDLLVELAAVGSLASVGAVLLNSDKATQFVDGLLCLVSTYLSWAMVHTMFAGRYGRLYYRDDNDGGIDFNSSDDPDGGDFLYFSFNLGMTYQVSDTSVSSRVIRRTVLLHCLISWLFGTVIIACAINLVVGLVSNSS